MARRKTLVVPRRVLQLANAALAARQAPQGARLVGRPSLFTAIASDPLTVARRAKSAFTVKLPAVGPGLALGLAVLAGARPAFPSGVTAAVAMISFGDVTTNILAGTAATTIGTITLTCASACGSAITVGLGPGQHDAATRNLGSGSGALLQYNLFSSLRNQTANSPWGDTSGNWEAAGTLTRGVTDVLSVYARIYESQQTAPVGSYSDVVAVTISY